MPVREGRRRDRAAGSARRGTLDETLVAAGRRPGPAFNGTLAASPFAVAPAGVLAPGAGIGQDLGRERHPADPRRLRD